MKNEEKKPRLVRSPLNHNGDFYAEGETVALSDAEAEVLEALGVVGPVSDPEPAKETTPPPKSEGKEPVKN